MMDRNNWIMIKMFQVHLWIFFMLWLYNNSIPPRLSEINEKNWRAEAEAIFDTSFMIQNNECPICTCPQKWLPWFCSNFQHDFVLWLVWQKKLQICPPIFLAYFWHPRWCGTGKTYISIVVIGIFVANIPAYGINPVTSTGHICTCKFCRSSNLYNSIRVIYCDRISNVKSQSRDHAIFKAK